RAAPPPPAPRPPRLDYLRQSAAVVAPSTCRAAAALPTQEPFQLLRPALPSIFSSPRTWRRVREDRSGGRIHSRGRGHTLTSSLRFRQFISGSLALVSSVLT